MAFFTAGFGLLLHVLFWGAGLALILTPRQWKTAWPGLCAPAGLALQSAVVWLAARTSVSGAQVYGRYAEVLPIFLLGLAVWKTRSTPRRHLWAELRAWQGVGFLTFAVLTALLIPFSVSSKVLTSSSLGSCDAGDYAAGARVLLEFSRYDRGGFMGLREVVQLHSVDNFFDHWIRLNHFTPSALLALNGSVLGYRPFEIVSVLTAVFLALSIGPVYWLARYTFRFRPLASIWVAGIYGFSPVLWYAVYHVAMSQLLAGMAIALLNGAALALWSDLGRKRWTWQWSGWLGVAYGLIMGAYNFIVIVCLIPALGYVAFRACQGRAWGRLGRWLLLSLVPLLVIAVVFAQRTLGLLERFMLFQQYDFGWNIPVVTPEGWLGWVADTELAACAAEFRWPLLALVLGLGIWGAWRAKGATRDRVLLACAALLPVTLGYAFLEIRGAVKCTHASYDAYKLLCVFLPFLIPAVSLWLTAPRRSARRTQLFLALVALSFFGAEVAGACRFIQRMQSPPLIVRDSLADLQRLENVKDVKSINLRIDDFWSRLWANSFLLRKEQYFPSYTYEGRRNTDLKGDWDLYSGIIRFHTPDAREETHLHFPYSMLDTRSPYFLRACEKDGWFESEGVSRSGTRWRWTQGDASIGFMNPHGNALPVEVKFLLRSLGERDVELVFNGKELIRQQVDGSLRPVAARFELPPGKSVLELKSSLPPTSPGPGDERKLGVAVFVVDVDVLHDLKDPPVKRRIHPRALPRFPRGHESGLK